nr:60S ribosomal protein L39-like [Coffea arabica]
MDRECNNQPSYSEANPSSHWTSPSTSSNRRCVPQDLHDKEEAGKKQIQNRPIPYWICMRTDNTIRYNAKRRHWRRTKLGF